MKRLTFVFCFLILFFGSCHKKSEKDLFQEQIQNFACDYAKNELQVNDADSVVVNLVDTVTEMSYAKIVLEMLENLEYQYKTMYDKATINNDDKNLQYLEMYLRQISTQVDYFRSVEGTGDLDNQKLLLYLISGSYYQNGTKEDFICFANPDFTLHILDPFADNLLY